MSSATPGHTPQVGRLEARPRGRLGFSTLSVNQLSGSIPASFGRPGLKALLLEYNALTGPVPDSIWQNATSLQTL